MANVEKLYNTTVVASGVPGETYHLAVVFVKGADRKG